MGLILLKDNNELTSIIKTKIEIAEMPYQRVHQKTMILVLAFCFASMITLSSKTDDRNTLDVKTTKRKPVEGNTSTPETMGTNQSGSDNSTDEGDFECDYRSLDGIIGCFWLLLEGIKKWYEEGKWLVNGWIHGGVLFLIVHYGAQIINRVHNPNNLPHNNLIQPEHVLLTMWGLGYGIGIGVLIAQFQ